MNGGASAPPGGTAALAVAAAARPRRCVANSYVLSVATLVLYLAYVGQAWNVMMGFAGQLSLGHSLYVGVGAYAAAGCSSTSGSGPGRASGSRSPSAPRSAR